MHNKCKNLSCYLFLRWGCSLIYSLTYFFCLVFFHIRDIVREIFNNHSVHVCFYIVQLLKKPCLYALSTELAISGLLSPETFKVTENTPFRKLPLGTQLSTTLLTLCLCVVLFLSAVTSQLTSQMVIVVFMCNKHAHIHVNKIKVGCGTGFYNKSQEYNV